MRFNAYTWLDSWLKSEPGDAGSAPENDVTATSFRTHLSLIVYSLGIRRAIVIMARWCPVR